MQSKKCSKCKEIKSIDNFHISKKEPCGYKSRCKDCRNLDNRIRRRFQKVKKELEKESTIDSLMNPIERACKTCGEKKPLEEFNKSKRHKLGRMYDCKVCRNKANRDRKNDPKNKQKYLEKHREWKKNNKDKVKLSNKRYSIKNSEKIKERNKEYRKNNPEKRKESVRKYNENNRDVLARKKAIRRTNEVRCTPSWSENEKIKVLYKKAKELGELTGLTYHVDHIIPLNSKKVCGLHVWANLQILEASLNCSKQNKLINIEVIYEEEE